MVFTAGIPGANFSIVMFVIVIVAIAVVIVMLVVTVAVPIAVAVPLCMQRAAGKQNSEHTGDTPFRSFHSFSPEGSGLTTG
jgi:hypothetical protein